MLSFSHAGRFSFARFDEGRQLGRVGELLEKADVQMAEPHPAQKNAR
jgi:hypothetical protein